MRYIIVAKPLTHPPETITVKRASDSNERNSIPQGGTIHRTTSYYWGKGVFEKENCKLQIIVFYKVKRF